MPYPCQIEDLPLQPVLAVRLTTPVEQLPQRLGAAYAAIMQQLATLGEPPAGAPYAAYLNMDMKNLHVEAGFPVERALPGNDAVIAGQGPAGRCATCVHRGPYSTLAATYEALTGYIAEQGETPTGITYEFYLTDPNETAPEAMETRIVFPLK